MHSQAITEFGKPLQDVETPNPTPTGCTTTQSAYTYTDSSGTHTRPGTTANFNLANGFGCAGSLGVERSLAARAFKNSRNSAPVRVGNPSVECATMSVWLCSAR